jgi:hypothetical protein
MNYSRVDCLLKDQEHCQSATKAVGKKRISFLEKTEFYLIGEERMEAPQIALKHNFQWAGLTRHGIKLYMG